MVLISSFHYASSGGRNRKFNFMGCIDELSCLILGGEVECGV